MGAGVSYTTLFSTSHGRLDLISWEFTSFIGGFVLCSTLQLYSPWRRMAVSAAPFFQILLHFTTGILPSTSGIILLSLSVARVDVDSQAQGSQTAIRIAGYIPAIGLGLYVAFGALVLVIGGLVVFVVQRSFSSRGESTIVSPSHLINLESRWRSLPGGNEYSDYHKRQLTGGPYLEGQDIENTYSLGHIHEDGACFPYFSLPF